MVTLMKRKLNERLARKSPENLCIKQTADDVEAKSHSEMKKIAWEWRFWKLKQVVIRKSQD